MTEATAESPHLKLQAENRESELKMAWVFKLLESTPRHSFSSKATPPKCPRAALTQNKIFKCQRQWGPSHSNLSNTVAARL